jgi:hypothetical protein
VIHLGNVSIRIEAVAYVEWHLEENLLLGATVVFIGGHDSFMVLEQDEAETLEAELGVYRE